MNRLWDSTLKGMKIRISLLAIFISGILLYGVVLFNILPQFQLVKYWHAADLFLKGQLRGERLLDFSPLYLYLNVFFYKLHSSLTSILWLHILSVVVSSCLLFLLLKRFFHFLLAVCGSIAFLFSGSLMIFTHTLEPEALVILFAILTVYFLVKLTPASALIGGISFGLGMLTRPNFVPVAFIVPFYFLLNSTDRSWIKKTYLFLIPVLLCLSGIWIRNFHQLGYFVPVVMNPGTAIYEGNNPNSWGMSSVYPPVLNQVSENYSGLPDYHHQLYRDFARNITGKNLQMFQVNSFWTRKVSQFLIDNPGHAFRLAVTKVLHIFHEFQWHDLASSYANDVALQRSWIPSVPFALISALAIAGLLILSPQWQKYLLFYGYFFSQFLFMFVIYVSARQRVSILFLFIIFACGALQYIFASKKRLLLLAVILPFSILLYMKSDFMNEEEHLWDNTLLSKKNISEAYRLRNESKMNQAEIKSASALALTPWYLDSRRPANIRFAPGFVSDALRFAQTNDPASQMDRAVLLLENGQPQDASLLFEHLRESGYHLKREDQQSSSFYFYLARCAWMQGKKREVESYLNQGNQESPGDPWILSYLTALTGNLHFRNELDRYFDEIDGAYFLGKAYLETDQPAEAAKHFEYLVKMLPEFRKVYIYLAAALGNSGRIEEAANYYRKAIQMSPDPVFQEKAILNIFQQLADKENSAFAHYSYGVVLRQFGYYEEALVQQEKAKALDPQNSAFNQEISNLKRIIELNPSTN
jgi:tetratricopeptide (TPR) repeat protein